MSEHNEECNCGGDGGQHWPTCPGHHRQVARLRWQRDALYARLKEIDRPASDNAYQPHRQAMGEIDAELGRTQPLPEVLSALRSRLTPPGAGEPSSKVAEYEARPCPYVVTSREGTSYCNLAHPDVARLVAEARREERERCAAQWTVSANTDGEWIVGAVNYGGVLWLKDAELAYSIAQRLREFEQYRFKGTEATGE